MPQKPSVILDIISYLQNSNDENKDHVAIEVELDVVVLISQLVSVQCWVVLVNLLLHLNLIWSLCLVFTHSLHDDCFNNIIII